MNDTGKILVAAAAGAFIGGVLGILFAPDKGSETRHKIAESGKKLADAVKDKVNAGKEKFQGLRDRLREKNETVKEGVEEFAS